jgi:hypothetical protein
VWVDLPTARSRRKNLPDRSRLVASVMSAPRLSLRGILGLSLYLSRLARARSRMRILKWRLHTAHGAVSGRPAPFSLSEALEFGEWCWEMRRYRTIECKTI